MENIWNFIKKNREEAIRFLKTQPDKRYEFVRWDKEKKEWIDPHFEGEDNEIYPDEVAPFVVCSDNDGNIAEYIVTQMWLETDHMGDKIAVNVVNVNDYDDCYDYPVNWLYGVSEVYVYEMMRDLGLEA